MCKHPNGKSNLARRRFSIYIGDNIIKIFLSFIIQIQCDSFALYFRFYRRYNTELTTSVRSHDYDLNKTIIINDLGMSAIMCDSIMNAISRNNGKTRKVTIRNIFYC